MKYKGKELKTGSDFYAAAMNLMSMDSDPKRVQAALILFVEGAELRDRFCIMRIKEIASDDRYLSMLDEFCSEELMASMKNILRAEHEEKLEAKISMSRRKGVFGVFAHKPINHEAAMAFNKTKYIK